ncbi:MAG: HEAT repeat domain-containing protein [Elusimicrobia bacterium]|nr:HEAT repeat domain-containing protein [Elusimicrobiota bacterium]
MADITEIKLDRAKQIAVEQFVTGMVTGSKTIGLYRAGHSIINQIGDRALALLTQALGQDTTLTFEVKAKQLVVNDAELPETADSALLASTLHTLGVGQVLFTNRLSRDGMLEFFKILIWKADEKTSLTDIQKAVQQIRIDGMQLTFVLSFVVTGEQAQADQPPGHLTEEQIQAYLAASTLSDYLYLLLKQNEPLIGKEAENVSGLLDGVLNRELSVEKFSEQMPWASYDARIKARFDEITGRPAGSPKTKGAGTRKGRPKDPWNAPRSITAYGVYTDGDVAIYHDHTVHEKNVGVANSMARVHFLLENPQAPSQPKFAVQAYTRFLIEMSRDGDVPGLLREYEFVKALSAKPELAEGMKQLETALQERLASAPFAARVVERLAEIAQDSEEFGEITSLLLFVGGEVLPLLLEEMRRLADKHTRAKLAALITTICLQWGAKALVEALKDEDYFLVSQVVLILGNLGSADFVKPIVPLLRHKHERVREAARKVLGKLGGAESRDAIAAFMLATEDTEEAKQAATALSLMQQEGVDSKLIEGYTISTDYDLQVHLVSAMARVGSPAVEELLHTAGKRTFWERIMGRKKELVEAAAKSLEEIAADKKRHHGA